MNQTLQLARIQSFTPALRKIMVRDVCKRVVSIFVVNEEVCNLYFNSL